VSRPYESLLAKGEDRRQHVLEVALHKMATGGGRATTLGQIARAAGVSTAGLLHHFSSKEQLLHAVLDARDGQDEAIADLRGDLESQLRSVRKRFDRAPGMVGTFIVLLCESLEPEAPLHERFLRRYRTGLAMIATGIRRGQQAGRYRADVDGDVKAREVLAFLYGLEATWLLDPDVPVDEVFSGYTSGLLEELCAR
jgi:AcrR family transcriptional regulator